MWIQKQLRKRTIGRNDGFTLIEIAIVLIIIGIIIGMVIKGKDLIRSGEQKKIYSQFLNGWKTAYLNFYDRTGKILGDTSGDRRADTNPIRPGQPPTDIGRDALVLGDTQHQPPQYYGLEQIGVKAPSSNTDKAWKYKYSDSSGQAHELTIAFYFDVTDKYNYLQITSIPNELSMALDTMIDGEADGSKGDFIGDGPRGKAWSANPTEAITARWKLDY